MNLVARLCALAMPIAIAIAIAAAVATAPSAAMAQNTITEAQRAKLELLRKRVGGEIQLAAYDLIDEIAYGWVQKPVFPKPTPVVLAGVSVPVGLGK